MPRHGPWTRANRCPRWVWLDVDDWSQDLERGLIELGLPCHLVDSGGIGDRRHAYVTFVGSCQAFRWPTTPAGWRGFTMTAAGLRLLHDLRRTLLEPPAQLRSRGEPPAAEHGSEQPAQPAAEVVRSA